MANKRIRDLTDNAPLSSSTTHTQLEPEKMRFAVHDGGQVVRVTAKELGFMVRPEYFHKDAQPNSDTTAAVTGNDRAFEAIGQIPGLTVFLGPGRYYTSQPVDLKAPWISLYGVTGYSGLIAKHSSGPTLRMRNHMQRAESIFFEGASSRAGSKNNQAHHIDAGPDEVTNPADPDYDAEAWVEGRSPVDYPAGSTTNGEPNEAYWMLRGLIGIQIRDCELKKSPGDGIHLHSLHNSEIYQNVCQNIGGNSIYISGGLESVGTGSYVGRSPPGSSQVFCYQNRLLGARSGNLYADGVIYSWFATMFCGNASSPKTGVSPTPVVFRPPIWVRGGKANLFEMMDVEGHSYYPPSSPEAVKWFFNLDGETPYSAIFPNLGHNDHMGTNFAFQDGGVADRNLNGYRVVNTTRMIHDALWANDASGQTFPTLLSFDQTNRRASVNCSKSGKNVLKQSSNSSWPNRYFDAGEKLAYT